jgi:hypothetical protein
MPVTTRIHTTRAGLYWIAERRIELFKYSDTRGIDAQYEVLRICAKFPRESAQEIEKLIENPWFRENHWLIFNLCEGGLLVIK